MDYAVGFVDGTRMPSRDPDYHLVGPECQEPELFLGYEGWIVWLRSDQRLPDSRWQRVGVRAQTYDRTPGTRFTTVM